jgi:hypothetical protein
VSGLLVGRTFEMKMWEHTGTALGSCAGHSAVPCHTCTRRPGCVESMHPVVSEE